MFKEKEEGGENMVAPRKHNRIPKRNKLGREKNLCNTLGSISRSNHDHRAEVDGNLE